MILREKLDFSALAKSVVVHVTVITACLVSWQCSEPRLVKMPAHVKAVVVSKGSLADRPMMNSKPQEQPPKKITPQPPKKPEPKKAEPPKPVPKPPEPAKPEPKKPEPPKPTPKKPEPKKPEPKKPEPKKPEPKKPKPKDFSDLFEEAETDDQAKPTKPTKASDAPSASTSPVVDKYLAGIRSEIERRWSRPPLSRNGMQVLLRIFLLPGGELSDVQVVESSGNAAFDRSALAAVQKVGSFIVPSDPVEFDRNFRQFTVLFNPDDLTY